MILHPDPRRARSRTTRHALTSPALVAAAFGMLLLSSATVHAIPLFPTPTPTNTVGIASTPTQTHTAVPATVTATQTSVPIATLAPTQSPVPTATISFAATSVKSKKSNISDRVAAAYPVTASTTLSGPSDTKTVYQTPSGGDFVLTQICVSPTAAGGLLVSAAGLGPVAQLGGSVRSCQSFNPGFILPPNAAVTCATSEGASPGAYFCMIAGQSG